MDSYILNQEDLLDRVIKGFTNYKKSPKQRITVAYIESRQESLDNWRESFDTIHSRIVGGTEKDKRSKIPYFVNDIYSEFENVYIEFKTKMKEDLRTLGSHTISGPSPGQSTSMSTEVKLPQIHLPKFSGSYDEWQTFHDMFLSLIHVNKSLSAVQKLHYLKGCLSGEAEQLLKNLSTTDVNYEEAWCQLTRRYTNKRYNCNEIMKRLFGQRNLTSESATGIKQLLDTTSACLKAFNNLQIDTDSWDAIVNYLVISRLDSESRKLWEFHISQSEKPEELPTWKQLSTFLETRFRTLEMLDGGRTVHRSTHNNFNSRPMPIKKALHSSVDEKNNLKNNEKVCVMCDGAHAVYQCKQFEKQSPEERSQFVQTKGLCFNCLSSNHQVRNCRQPICCRRCGRRHHLLLHYDRVNRESNLHDSTSHVMESTPVPNGKLSREPEKKVVAHFATEISESCVLLATAMVRVKSCNGHSLIIRVLIDQGSEVSFVTESIAQALGLKKSFVNGIVSGIGEGQTKTKSLVSVKVESLHHPDFSITINAFVLKKLTSFLPYRKTVIFEWPMLQNLSLADPKYGTPGQVDMILGADVYGTIMIEGLLKHPSKNSPIAQNTQFGWILSGTVERNNISGDRRVVSLHTQVKEDDLLKQFWEIEREPDFIGKRMTKEELRCEEFYEETTERDKDGRYIVRLPFKNPNPECVEGKSREIAMRRLKQLERRLCKDPKLYVEYQKVIDDYIHQEHIELLEKRENIEEEEVVYLPHHAVVRDEKETTKVRIVYNASSKGVNNISLNDDLLVGPKLQPDLRHTLMRWRRHGICIVADLKQMYRQIKVNKKDINYQRILWRSSINLPVQHYRLLRLTFGTACAPYLAVKSLQQLAKDEENKYPIASTITIRDYYMDDLLTGCEGSEEAIEIYEQMSKLMKAGGFELQKWSTNCKELLNNIKEESQKIDQSVVFKTNEMIKVLGIVWNKNTDNFEYSLHLPERTEIMTKRKVLSDIARLYARYYTLSYCKRVSYYKLEEENRPKNVNNFVTPEEREEVLKICVRETQNLHFEEEIKQLKANKSLPSNSKLLTLSPFIDNSGILRVGGRIREAEVELDRRHPIILPSESHLTKLIVEDAHVRSLHGGPQLILNLLRSKFWIIRARQLAKKCYRTCIKCIRYIKQNNNPLMGQIPDVRLKPIRPFKITGVDFTGHINIRFSPGRGSKSFKGYICVFVCMFTKAIHLEAVSDLSAQGFIAAFRRFVSRRGHCQTLYSDNGTNFVGASKELKEMFDRSTSQLPDEIGKLLANDGTTWSFIPPHAPNFGGLWEAGVRSTKAHLKRVIGDSTLTFEELSTVLTQIEACLNSRPLSHLSNCSDDPMPLTPGHFLVGEPLIILPDENYENKNITGLQRWKLTQRMVSDFWRKWSDEYLVTLNQRYKWNVKKSEPEIDDIVVLKDFNLPPAKWLLGKIIQKHSGKDEITRVVTIKTKNGLYKRPCNKLCFLPKSDSDSKN